MVFVLAPLVRSSSVRRKWRRNKPVDVSNIRDLMSASASKLFSDGNKTKVARQRKVGNHGGSKNSHVEQVKVPFPGSLQDESAPMAIFVAAIQAKPAQSQSEPCTVSVSLPTHRV